MRRELHSTGRLEKEERKKARLFLPFTFYFDALVYAAEDDEYDHFCTI